jgi:hypothetical protein
MRSTSTQSLIAVVIAIVFFGRCCDGQLMRRKRVSPVLAIEDLNPFSHHQQNGIRIKDRNLGIGGSHSSGGGDSNNNKTNKRDKEAGKKEKASKEEKSSKDEKASKEEKSSKSYKREFDSGSDFMSIDSGSFDFMSMDFCMSLQPTAPLPTPTDPPPTPTVPPPTPTTPPMTPTAPPPTSIPDPSPTDPPVSAPVPDPTMPPDGCEAMSREDALAGKLSAVTDSSTLTNPSSPQGMAFRWLVDADPAAIDPCSYPTVEQRYALTTMYYSTNGDDWTDSTGWLSQSNECTWFGVSCGTDLVTGINLGTCQL